MWFNCLQMFLEIFMRLEHRSGTSGLDLRQPKSNLFLFLSKWQNLYEFSAGFPGRGHSLGLTGGWSVFSSIHHLRKYRNVWWKLKKQSDGSRHLSGISLNSQGSRLHLPLGTNCDYSENIFSTLPKFVLLSPTEQIQIKGLCFVQATLSLCFTFLFVHVWSQFWMSYFEAFIALRGSASSCIHWHLIVNVYSIVAFFFVLQPHRKYPAH